MIMNDMTCHAYDCNVNACVTPGCYTGGGGDPRRALMGWDQVCQRGECGDRESPASCACDARGDDNVPRRRGGWSATSGATSAAV
jgi:Tfp pilus assembly protein PilV